MYPKNIPVPFPIEIVDIPSTNYRVGRAGLIPSLIVIHIAEGSKASVISEFKTPYIEKSSHFLVNKDGSITQFVSTKDAAFGNGIIDNPVSQLILERGTKSANDMSISIEHEGFAVSDLTPAQYTSTTKLVKFLSEKWGIALDSTHVIRHREINGGKSCPGLANVEKIIQKARLM